jgi:hypothetical protein
MSDENKTILYHHTSPEHRKAIMSDGLLLEKSYYAQSGGVGVIFFDSIPRCDDSDVWAADVTGLEVEPDDTTVLPDEPEWEGHTWWAIYCQDIGPERLTLHYAAKE